MVVDEGKVAKRVPHAPPSHPPPYHPTTTRTRSYKFLSGRTNPAVLVQRSNLYEYGSSGETVPGQACADSGFFVPVRPRPVNIPNGKVLVAHQAVFASGWGDMLYGRLVMCL